MHRVPWRTLVPAALAVVLSVGLASQASAVPRPPESGPPGGVRADTALVFTRTGAGQSVDGFVPPTGTPFDPLAGYPATAPAGWTSLDEGFAGTLIATPPGGGPADEVAMYCIDILTVTRPGYGYVHGEWTEANVPNVGLVAQILNGYYPAVPGEPAALPTDAQRAAAVQASIWFFTDDYVLADGDPLRPVVAAIVADVLALGPAPEPTPPTLEISPESARGPAGGQAGPFTITTDDPAGAQLALLNPLPGVELVRPNGTVIPPGTLLLDGEQFFVRGTVPQPGINIAAQATEVVPSGSVYLYDGNTVGVTTAQKLILAQTVTTRTTARATAELFQAGSLVVTKTIAGSGAGAQGEVVIEVVCDGVALDPFVIPAGTAPGDVVRQYDGIEVPATCTITETADGANAAATVTVTGSGQTVEVPAEATEPVAAEPVVNTYTVVTTTTTTGRTTTTGGTGTTQGGGGTLPRTGSEPRPLVAVGTAALAAGLGLGALARWRRRRAAG